MEELHHDGSNSTDTGTHHQATLQPQTIQLSQLAQQVSMGSSVPVTVLQLPGGQSVQVQGVIQTAQSSVIQAPQIHTVQVSALSESDDSQESSDSVSSSQKSREILSRRPSYRKILNELSSGDTANKSEGKGEEEVGGVPLSSMIMPTPIYQTSTGQYIAIAPGGTIQLASPGAEGVQGLQTLTMTNAGGGQQGTTILQYAQTADGQQILVPSNQVVVQTASGDMQTYQIRTAPSTNSLPQTVMMTSPVTLQSQGTKAEDATLKREIRLMKNSFRLSYPGEQTVTIHLLDDQNSLPDSMVGASSPHGQREFTSR